jgi:hypothetical protein
MRVPAHLLCFAVCVGLFSSAVDAAVPAPTTRVPLVDVQWPGYGYGAPVAPGYGQEWEGRREHCSRMRDRLRQIRYRMETGPYWERDRLEGRFHEVRERLRHECWGHWRED